MLPHPIFHLILKAHYQGFQIRYCLGKVLKTVKMFSWKSPCWWFISTSVNHKDCRVLLYLVMLKVLKMIIILFFSFGYPPTATTVTSGVTHLQNQVYDICFRRASGYCYICYVSYFCNLIWWQTFWALIILICAPSKSVKGKRENINKKKKEEDLKARRGCTKL